jgi:hypothetical protein
MSRISFGSSFQSFGAATVKDRSPNDRKKLPLGNSSILLSNYAIKYEMQASRKTTNKNFYVQSHQTNQLHTNKI